MYSLGDLLLPVWGNILEAPVNPWPHGDAWHEIYQRCESPIERRMCIEIRDRLGYAASAGHVWQDRADLQEKLAKHGAVVFGQQQIGRYRVDFLIVMFLPGWQQLSMAAIECDGWKFHSGTQAREYDARRDEWLSGAGLKVIRFSGHEIVRKPGQVLGRIPEQMGARLSEFLLWGETQPELAL